MSFKNKRCPSCFNFINKYLPNIKVVINDDNIIYHTACYNIKYNPDNIIKKNLIKLKIDHLFDNNLVITNKCPKCFRAIDKNSKNDQLITGHDKLLYHLSCYNIKGKKKIESLNNKNF